MQQEEEMRTKPSLTGWALGALSLVACSTSSSVDPGADWELSRSGEISISARSASPNNAGASSTSATSSNAHSNSEASGSESESAPSSSSSVASAAAEAASRAAELAARPVAIGMAPGRMADAMERAARMQEQVDDVSADDPTEEVQQVAEEPPHFAPMFNRWYAPGWPYNLPLGDAVVPVEPLPYEEVNKPVEFPWNPFRQNILKGDFPLPGTKDLFLNITVTERFIAQTRRVPTPTNNVGAGPINPEFWGDSKQEAFNNDFVVSFDLFKAPQNFKPVEWRLRVSPVFNVNVLDVREKGITSVDVTNSTYRRRDDFALQEALFEYHLYDFNRRYDFLSIEAGIFPFRSDFRGFVFDDVQRGLRLVGNADNNKWQYNLAVFDMLDKDTNSLLNKFEDREQAVLIANVYRQDWPFLGYISNFSFHYNRDRLTEEVDDNGFVLVPYPHGNAEAGDIDAYYLGWAGEGHIGRVNISHAFYQVFGEQEENFLAGRDVDINAQLAAMELSVDIDWWRLRVYGMYASGDSDPADSQGEGFDAIMDAPNFAGGEFSYFNSQAIPIGVNGLLLSSGLSPLPDLQKSKFQAPANYVNPGLNLIGAAVNADLTPRSRVILGTNYMLFDDTASLERFFQPVTSRIDRQIGLEFYSQLQYRPLLTNNVIFNIGASALVPGDGFERIYQNDETLYTVFLQMLLTY